MTIEEKEKEIIKALDVRFTMVNVEMDKCDYEFNIAYSNAVYHYDIAHENYTQALVLYAYLCDLLDLKDVYPMYLKASKSYGRYFKDTNGILRKKED